MSQQKSETMKYRKSEEYDLFTRILEKPLRNGAYHPIADCRQFILDRIILWLTLVLRMSCD